MLSRVTVRLLRALSGLSKQREVRIWGEAVFENEIKISAKMNIARKIKSGTQEVT